MRLLLQALLVLGTLSCTSSPAPASKFLGNVLGSGVRAPDRDAAFLTYWDQVSPGNVGKWGVVERDRDRLDWSGLDSVYRFSRDHRMPFKEHVLVWGNQQPEWIGSLPPEEQRREVEDWIRSLCERYPDAELIDVVNEPLHIPPKQYKKALGGDGKTGWDWVVWSFETARRHAPKAVLILNEHSLLKDDVKLSRFLEIVRILKTRGLIDAVGLQGHFLEHTPARDVQRRLDTVAAEGLPVYISEFDLNLADDSEQLQRMQELFPVFWGHPAVRGVTLWGYKEGQIWRKDAYLLRGDGTERPALRWLRSYVGKGLVPLP